MKKKQIALLLGAVMTITMLAGCGDESSPSNLKAPPNSGTAPTATMQASGSNLPAATAPASDSDIPGETPSQFPENRQEMTLSNGDNATKHDEDFADDMGFTIFVANDYTTSMEGDVAYIRSKSKPDEAYIEVKYIKGGKADAIAPSVLDDYDKISDLVDNDMSDVGIVPYRLVEGHGEKADWKAYVLQGVKGVIQVVIRMGAGEGTTLEAMMETFNPK